jgi:drug/metabolite transporter (DMT)-like permease
MAAGKPSVSTARLLLLIAIVIWGWTFVASKICLQYLSGVELLAMRYIIGFPFLYLMIRFRKLPIDFKGEGMRTMVFASFLLAGHLLIQITGLHFTTATNTGWIIGVTPLTIALLSRLILKEKLHRGTAVGIVVASVGIILLISKGKFDSIEWLHNVGDWIILGSTITWSLYSILVATVAKKHNPMLVSFHTMLYATILFVVYMITKNDWSKVLALPLEGITALVFLAILGMVIANWFWQIGVTTIGATQSGMFLYLEPLATTALAIPYLGEPFTWATGVGGALVLGGVYLSQFMNGKRSLT